MANKWLETSLLSEVYACNAEPYGYPSKGEPLLGGVVSESVGVGWTVERFPVEKSETGSSYVVEVDESFVPQSIKSKLKTAKPKVKVTSAAFQ